MPDEPKAQDGPVNEAVRFIKLGRELTRMGKLTKAEACYRKAIALQPDFAKAYNGLGLVHLLEGKLSEAESDFRRALAIKPDYANAHTNILLCLNYNPHIGEDTIFEEHQLWGACHGRPKKEIRPHSNDRSINRRLRIGYVSPDFRKHSVSYFFEPLLAGHNRERFEIFCYAEVPEPDETTERLRQLADRWVNIAGLSDEECADLIRGDRIDILVDLAGHTRRNRLQVFVQKPAPIQVSWLGYPNTTGIPSIDYRLTDAVADPEGSADRFNTENLIRLPNGFLCYAPPSHAAEVMPLPALTKGYVTFGSFNNLAKITPDALKLWCSILSFTPRSRLVLKNLAFTDEILRSRYQEFFTGEGIDPSRIDMIPWNPSRKEHLALYGSVDISLDTFPYNGTTTTCESLWMGVPVVTMKCDRHAGRVGASILSRVGLEYLVAKSPTQYLDIALTLAGDLMSLAGLREGLRERMTRSSLCNPQSFAGDVEDAYREIWRRWCNSSSS